MNFAEAIAYLKNTSPLRITISGDIGAGKSTFAKHLSEKLGIPRVYIGQLMREEAARRHLTLDAFNALLETDDTIDRYMDDLQKEKSRQIERGIFEGRTSWHFVENPDVRVFLAVNPHTAAQRIWEDNNALRDTYDSIDALAEANEQRKASENARYQAYYGIDAYNPKNFDIIVDTTSLNISHVFEQGVTKIADTLKNRHKTPNS